MKKIIKFLIIILIVYLIYAFVSAIIIYVFKNPNAEEQLETFTGNSQKQKTETSDRVQLIESAEDSAIIRLRLIENAEESIDIAYYTFRNGEIAKMILGGILEAADRGVEVRILLDSLSILPFFTGQYKYLLYGLDSHKNINFKFYHPIHPSFPFNWNKRLHDKMILVDENLALVGGRNIADNYYVKNTKWLKFSKDRDVVIFKDQSLRDNYSVIKDMKNYYEDTWNYKYSKSFIRKLPLRGKTKSNIECKNLKVEHIKTKESYKNILDNIIWYEYTTAVDKIQFVHNPVGEINQDPWCLRELLFLSSQANESIFMQSPYIIPTGRMKANFNQYDIDLEKAKILTNSYYSSPNHLSIAAYSNHRKKIIDRGVGVYEYQGEGSIHGKTYIFDDYISAIGSFNLDARSSYINSESMIVIFSEEFAETLKENIKVDLDQSLEVGFDYSYIEDENIKEGQVSKTKKIILFILSKIAPILEHIL